MNQKSILRTFLLFGALLGATLLVRAEAAFDEAPVPVHAAMPILPAALRAAGASGLVSIKVTIDTNGTVTDAAVAKSTNVEFERPAIEAVQQWKFRPAKKGGQPVVAQVMVPVRFSSAN